LLEISKECAKLLSLKTSEDFVWRLSVCLSVWRLSVAY